MVYYQVIIQSCFSLRYQVSFTLEIIASQIFSLQDAKKGVLFIDFPPVLQLQLKRFEYDFSRDMMVKVVPTLLRVLLFIFNIHSFFCEYD